MMDFLRQQWPWITSNPWGAIGLCLSFFLVGWGAARLIYHERLELLKEKNKAAESKPQETTFSFPQSGRSGRNILSNSIHTIVAQEKLSMRAEVPKGTKIHIELVGPVPAHLEDTDASWFYSTGHIINWTASDYEQDNGGKQFFDAEEGVADLQIYFARAGDVVITAYEGTSQKPSWTKKLTVRDAS